MVLVTSEREGFGLPILEALAAGATVIASDIPPFREVAADVATYCTVGDVEQWAETVTSLLEHPDFRPSTLLGRALAKRYTWTAHAAKVADAYATLVS